MGLAIRLLLSPFFAHPEDVFSWYALGFDFLNGAPVWTFLVPNRYGLFLFAFPATFLFNLLSQHILTYTIQMSSIDPRLVPANPAGITVIPGLLFDFLVKLPLIASDAIITILLFRFAKTRFQDEKVAATAAALWFLNPLSIWVSAGWGTFDTLPALFTVVALYLVLERRAWLAGLAIVVAIAVKLYAGVLIVPLLIIAQRIGGSRPVFKAILSTALSGLIMLLPSLDQAPTQLVPLVAASAPPGVSYSGLTFWTAVTLFVPSAGVTTLALALSSLALAAVYLWIWRNFELSPIYSVVSFVLPIASLLIFYRFVGENFFIWILPFLSLLVAKDVLDKRLFWLLTFFALVSSVTDSLLPYYMLPISPWIGSYLVHALALAGPYRVSPAGPPVAGLSIGKLLLSSLGIAESVVLILVVFTIARKVQAARPKGTATRADGPPPLLGDS